MYWLSFCLFRLLMSFNLGSYYHNLQSVGISGTCLFAWLLGRIKLSLRCVLDHISLTLFSSRDHGLSTHMRIHTYIHTFWLTSVPLFHCLTSLNLLSELWWFGKSHTTENTLEITARVLFFNFFVPVCFGLCLVLAVIGCLLCSLYFWTYPAR